MKLYQKILIIGVIIESIGLAGCNNKPKTLEGTVKEEFGTAPMIVGSSGALFGNESVKIGDPTYGLVLTNEQGEYFIDVYNYRTKPVIALARAIEPGDKVRINYNRYTRIGNDGIGTTYSGTIELIEKAKSQRLPEPARID